MKSVDLASHIILVAVLAGCAGSSPNDEIDSSSAVLSTPSPCPINEIPVVTIGATNIVNMVFEPGFTDVDKALYSKTLETQIAADDYLLSGWIPIDIADVNGGSGLNQEIRTDSFVVDSLENTLQEDQPTCPDEITFVSKQTISDIDIISSSDYTPGLPAGSSLRDVVSLAVEYSITDLRSLGVENIQLPSEQVTSFVPRVIPLPEESQTVEQLISIDNRIPLRISVRFLIPVSYTHLTLPTICSV